MAGNGWELIIMMDGWMDMVEYGWTLMEMTENSWKQLDMAIYGCKWL